MRSGTARGAGLRVLAVALVAAAAGTGCARLFSHYDVAPNGLQRRENELRVLLAHGRSDSAFTRLATDERTGPDDELLRSLYMGLLAHYAGEYEASDAALEKAAELAEDRYTKSVSRAALSLITSDRTLPYVPGWTERLLIPYYGALNRLQRGDREGAAVEARRLAALLERESSRAPDDRTTPLLAFLRYFTGTVFEAAGEWNDADVAYRNAHRLGGPAPPWGVPAVTTNTSEAPDVGPNVPPAVPSPAPDRPAARHPTDGEVIVLIEQAFVVHRVEQALHLTLHPLDVKRLTGSNGEARATAIADLAVRVMAAALHDARYRGPWYDTRPRTLRISVPPPRDDDDACDEEERSASGKGGRPARDPWSGAGEAPVRRPVTAVAHPASPGPPGTAAGKTPARGAGASRSQRAGCPLPNPYLLRVAWPVLRLDREPATSVRIAAGETDAPLLVGTDISSAIARDFDDERDLVLARTLARAVSKLALTRGVEKSVEERDEWIGQALGVLTNVGTALLEQADTRSWQLLPARIGLARIRLPAGEHRIEVEIGSARRIDLGTVTVRPGELSFVPARVWQ